MQYPENIAIWYQLELPKKEFDLKLESDEMISVDVSNLILFSVYKAVNIWRSQFLRGAASVFLFFNSVALHFRVVKHECP